MENFEQISFKTNDGFMLTGTAYHPAPGRENGDAVFIASAMGVARGYYHNFACFLMAEGYKVLTFDYRGIGDSWPDDVKGEDLFVQQWGEQDIPAAIQWVTENFEPSRLLMVGHSVGGQVLSLVPDNTRIDRIILVGSQAGTSDLWDGIEKLKILFFWKIALPALVAVAGKLPGWLLGSEDLPKGIALQWREWGTSPGYLHCLGPHVSEGFNRIKAPILFYSFADDSFAPPRAVDKLMDWYNNSPKERRHVLPADLGVKKIGHFGFFKSRFAPTLWLDANKWLMA